LLNNYCKNSLSMVYIISRLNKWRVI
jgi:hypothetical protein